MREHRSPAHAALRYAHWGCRVLPLHTPTRTGCSCGDLHCISPGKHPRTPHGVHDASRRSEQVREWWTRWPEANVAIVTGVLVVIDVEGEQGHTALRQLQERLDQVLPTTPWVDTARGRHLYFVSLGVEIASSAGRLGPGLDVHGARGYVVAPPSRDAGGHVYRWHGLRDGITALPRWLASELTDPTAPAGVGLRRPQ